jgi:hypothetical protein
MTPLKQDKPTSAAQFQQLRQDNDNPERGLAKVAA